MYFCASDARYEGQMRHTLVLDKIGTLAFQLDHVFCDSNTSIFSSRCSRIALLHTALPLSPPMLAFTRSGRYASLASLPKYPIASYNASARALSVPRLANLATKHRQPQPPLPIHHAPKKSSATTSYELRDYQQDAVKGVKSVFQNGINRMAVSIPTGGGKTLVMMACIRGMMEGNLLKGPGKKYLVIVPSASLANQAVEAATRFLPQGTVIGMEQGSHRSPHNAVV